MHRHNAESSGPDRSLWTATERRLVLIWEDVLAAKNVDLDDKFLDLGGDSIAATLCVTDVQDVFGVDLPIASLLDQEATLRCIATTIERAAESSGT